MLRILLILSVVLIVSFCGIADAQGINKACPFKPADIVFVLDGSGSEGDVNFRKQLAFIANFSDQFEIGPNHTRIGLVTFATAAHNEFYLTDNLSKPDVMQRINRTHYPNGETNTHKALDLVRIQQFSHRYDNRNVTKVVIVLTDGLSLEPTLLVTAANRLKSIPMLTTIAIGIGNRVDARELAIIATDSNHTFQVANFDQLQTITDELTETTCSICNADYTDIVFVLDSSGSEGPSNFHKQLDFVNLVINEFSIGSDATQVALVTFFTGATTEINLNSYRDASSLMQAVQQVPYRDGETYTHAGLNLALRALTQRRHGFRWNANKAVIVLTDGRSTEPDQTRRAAQHLHSKGVESYAIGIGSNVDLQELRDIATDYRHVYRVQDFNQLDSIHEQVVKGICAKNKFTTTTSTTTSTTTMTTTPTTPTTTTKPECGQKPADIVFVLDSSDSEGPENFQKALDFVYRFAVQFKIGPQNVQFSLVTFSTDVQNQFYFNTYHSRHDVLFAIRNTSYIGTGTDTAKALNFVRNESFLPRTGARSNATKLVVVITDGRSDSPDKTKAEAHLLHHGTEVFSIGVGPKVDATELGDIASNSRHVVRVNSFELLHTIEKKLTDTACTN